MTGIFIWFIAAGFLIVLYTLLGQVLLRYEQKERDRIYFEEKKVWKGGGRSLFAFFSDFVFTRGYIQRIKNRMQIYSPGQNERAEEKTMQIFLTGAAFSLVLLAVCVVTAPGLQTFLLSLCGIYFINTALIWQTAQKEERLLLEHFSLFLSEVRTKYQETARIEESIEAGINEKTADDMKAQGNYLLDIIQAEDAEEKAKEYMEFVKNAYLNEFLMLCMTIIQFGDPETEKQSLFLSNLRRLKRSIDDELLRRKKQNHFFSGYAFMISVPIFFMPFIARWGVHNIPALARFYYGSGGFALMAISVFFTFFIFHLNYRLQENDFFIEKNPILLTKISSGKFPAELIERLYTSNQRKRVYWEDMLNGSGERITVEEFIVKKYLYAFSAFFLTAFFFVLLPGRARAIETVISLLAAGLGYALPSLMLYIENLLSKHKRMDEIIRMQAVLTILSPIPQMTSEGMLRWLLHFSDLFKKPLLNFYDALASSEEETAKDLIDKESYDPFRKILQNLMLCDKVGVEKAFYELAGDRNYLLEERKQESGILLENKGAVGAFLAMSPTLLVTIGYLFTPVIIESFRMFFSQFKQIESFF